MSSHFNSWLVLTTENLLQAADNTCSLMQGATQDAHAVASGTLNLLEPELLVPEPGPQQPDTPSSATCPKQVS